LLRPHHHLVDAVLAAMLMVGGVKPARNSARGPRQTIRGEICGCCWPFDSCGGIRFAIEL